MADQMQKSTITDKMRKTIHILYIAKQTEKGRKMSPAMAFFQPEHVDMYLEQVGINKADTMVGEVPLSMLLVPAQMMLEARGVKADPGEDMPDKGKCILAMVQAIGLLSGAEAGDTTIDETMVIGGLIISICIYLMNLGANADPISAMYYNAAVSGWDPAKKEFAAFLPKKA